MSWQEDKADATRSSEENAEGVRRCRALNAAGERCGQATSVDPHSGLCIWHNPEREAEAKAARVKGGEGRRRTEIKTATIDQLPGGAPQTLDDVCLWASWAAWAVAHGILDARTSREVNYGLQTLRFGLEKRDLGRELAAVRQQLKELRTKRESP